jgi:hypothetical protein
MTVAGEMPVREKSQRHRQAEYGRCCERDHEDRDLELDEVAQPVGRRDGVPERGQIFGGNQAGIAEVLRDGAQPRRVAASAITSTGAAISERAIAP